MASTAPGAEESEIEKVRTWFRENALQTKYSRKTSGLGSSYLLAPDGSIIKLANKGHANKRLGEGSFGRVVITYRFDGPKTTATATKIQKVHRNNRNLVQAEAERNLDLGLATSGLIERPFNPHPDWYKTYQEMHNLGSSLREKIKGSPPLTDKIKLDLSIKLLIQVDELHTGQTSRGSKKYAHRDIKPANVMVDSTGEVRLIDFGFSTENIISRGPYWSGTDLYGPVDASNYFTKASLEAALANPLTQTYLEDDKIASLRTIFNPIDSSGRFSLFSLSEFHKLPECIRELLDTTTIAPLLTPERRGETVKFFAALLIAYQVSPEITRQDVALLRADVMAQEACIHYQKDPSQREGFIKNLLDRELRKSPIIDAMKEKLNLYGAYLKNKYMKPGASDESVDAMNDKLMCVMDLIDILNKNYLLNTDKLAEFKAALIPRKTLLSAHYVPPAQDRTKRFLTLFDSFTKPVGKTLVEELDALLLKQSTPPTEDEDTPRSGPGCH